jgi:Zn-dependent M28 family amino/carboxypeptidase
MKLHFCLVSVLAFLSAVAAAQPGSEPEFKPADFRKHVDFLASDLLEGRDAGTRGYDIAAAYVASQLQGLGLEAAPNGEWAQAVPFVKHKLGAGPAGITIGGHRYAHGEGAIIAANPHQATTRLEAKTVYVGYGLDLPGHGYNDYAGLDVKDKVVVMIGGVPEGVPSDLAAHFMQYKAVMAANRGAVGMITLRSPELAEKIPVAQIAKGSSAGATTWAAPDGKPFMAAPQISFGAILSPAAQDQLFRGSKKSAAKTLKEAEQRAVRPKGFNLKQRVKFEGQAEVSNLLYKSPNVLAVLRGSDPAVADEYVMLMAHLDGLGVDPSITAGDAIRNGAMDNATGIAALLETARAMTSEGRRPRRSIIFAAVTSEEDGLLGSSYLANNPVTKDGRIVSVVNLDMPVLLYDFQDVIAFGAEHSTLGQIVQRAGQKMNVSVTPDPLPEQGLFVRSDHYSFVKRGVPSVFLMTGFKNGGEKEFKGFLGTNYHKPSDDLKQPINWDAAAKFAQMNYLIASEVANSAEEPRWYKDSPFGDLFAGDQKRAVRLQ